MVVFWRVCSASARSNDQTSSQACAPEVSVDGSFRQRSVLVPLASNSPRCHRPWSVTGSVHTLRETKTRPGEKKVVMKVDVHPASPAPRLYMLYNMVLKTLKTAVKVQTVCVHADNFKPYQIIMWFWKSLNWGGVSDRPPVTDLRSTVQSSLKEQTFNGNS